MPKSKTFSSPRYSRFCLHVHMQQYKKKLLPALMEMDILRSVLAYTSFKYRDL